jgi:hypothetical protein
MLVKHSCKIQSVKLVLSLLLISISAISAFLARTPPSREATAAFISPPRAPLPTPTPCSLELRQHHPLRHSFEARLCRLVRCSTQHVSSRSPDAAASFVSPPRPDTAHIRTRRQVSLTSLLQVSLALPPHLSD